MTLRARADQTELSNLEFYATSGDFNDKKVLLYAPAYEGGGLSITIGNSGYDLVNCQQITGDDFTVTAGVAYRILVE